LQLILSYAALALSVACFISFSWAIARLFSSSPGVTFPLTLLGALGILFSIAQIALIVLARTASWRTASALVVYIVALGLFWWAVPQAVRGHLNVAFTNVKPVTLLVDGPYAYVRHPFYASYLLYWIAGALISGWLWISVFVMGSFYLTALHQEEESFRLSPLAAFYEVYRRKTGALFPVLQISKRK
jgi:protein-S-isoprenylcysteine O-methyltransferase Ste14